MALWWDADRSVKNALRGQGAEMIHGIGFEYRSGMLVIRLPSGRQLCYVKPRIRTNPFGGESVTYEGVGATKKWERIESYGPKFVENIVQAISRDIRCNVMRNLKGKLICGHMHDELIIEAAPEDDLNEICEKNSPGARLAARGCAAGGRVLLRVLYEGVRPRPCSPTLQVGQSKLTKEKATDKLALCSETFRTDQGTDGFGIQL